MNKFAELLNSVQGYKKILESINSNPTVIKRANIFEKLLNGEKPNIVITTGVLLNSFPKLVSYKNSVLNFAVGNSYNIEELSKRLVDCGYERSEIVEGVGQFTIRGGFFRQLQRSLLELNFLVMR